MNIFQATKYQLSPYPGKCNCCFFADCNHSFSLAIDKILDTQSQNYALTWQHPMHSKILLSLTLPKLPNTSLNPINLFLTYSYWDTHGVCSPLLKWVINSTSSITVCSRWSLAERHGRNGHLDSNAIWIIQDCITLLVEICEKWPCCKVPKSLTHYYMPFKTKFFSSQEKNSVNMWGDGC